MHEQKLVQDILDKIKKYKAKKVKIVVGELSGFTAEHLREHLNFPCEIEEEESLVECECGYRGRAKITEREHDFVLFECPKCSRIPEILKGKDVIVKEICV